MDPLQNNPAPGNETAAATATAELPNVRRETFKRIRRSLISSQLTLAEDVAGGDPYDSRRGRNPGAVWGKRRR